MTTLPLAPSQTDEPAEPRVRPGRVTEFFAVGGATPFLFLLSWFLRKFIGLDPAEYAVGFLTFHAAHVINDPHFAVTYLLFYKDGKARAFGGVWNPVQRARYIFAGLIAPLILAVWGISGLAMKSAFTVGLLIQLMFFLVGWHYVKQGFGVMVILAARRGVRFSARERLVILVHVFSGWAYAWASPADAGTEVEEKGIVYTTIAHSHGLERATFVVFIASAAALLVMLLRKWKREGRLPIITPMTALLCSIWSWSIYSSADPLVRYLIPALHSIQYLYFVKLLKGNQAREREGPPWFEMSARARLSILAGSAIFLGWILFHGAPTALDDMLLTRRERFSGSAMGPTPYFAALFAFVNIHHYFMDYVIWRRDNPETSYLMK